jgi:hypothetical protein
VRRILNFLGCGPSSECASTISKKHNVAPHSRAINRNARSEHPDNGAKIIFVGMGVAPIVSLMQAIIVPEDDFVKSFGAQT